MLVTFNLDEITTVETGDDGIFCHNETNVPMLELTEDFCFLISFHQIFEFCLWKICEDFVSLKCPSYHL